MPNENDNHNIIGQSVNPQENKLERIKKKQKIVRFIIIGLGAALIVLGVVLFATIRK